MDKVERERFTTYAAPAAVAAQLAHVSRHQADLSREAVWLTELLERRIAEERRGEWPYKKEGRA